MKNVHRERMAHHRTRSKAFFEAMQLLSDDLFSYGDAVALLAVHSAISLADAVLIATTGERSKDQDHSAAAKPLNRVCSMRKLDANGVKHLVWLLQNKSRFAYEDKPTIHNNIKYATVTAERFRAWVYRTFPEVAHENDSSS